MRRIAIILAIMLTAVAWAVDVENSEFDGAAREMSDGWTAEGDAAAVFGVNNADGVAGTTCLQYESQDERGETFVEQAVTLEPNTDYVLAAWFKSDGTTRPIVAVHEPGERDAIARVRSDGALSWTRSRVRFNSGPVAEAQLRVYGDFGPGRASRPGESRIDAIRIDTATEADQNGLPIPGGFAGPAPGENVALGKSYEWNIAPSYSLCTDPDDIVQLTDGEHSVGYFWTQESTVGWTPRDPLELTIDLEQVQPITGVSFNTAGGTAGVGFPSMIFVLTSEDGETFEYHGELIALSAEHGLPEPQEYMVHRYATDRLNAAGRYVRFVIVPGSKFLFSDEVEVWRGDFEVADASAGERVESTEQMIADHRLDGIVGVRLMYDIQDLRERIDRAEIDAGLKRELSDRLNALADEVRAQHVEEVEHWEGLPYNDLHARIYAVNAPLLRAQGHGELTVWPAQRWDMLDPMSAPEPGEAEIDVTLMRGEYRSAAFNITNPTDESVTARIIGGPQVHEVQYVQTQEREVTSNALPIAPIDDAGASLIEIPAGLTKQAWLTFDEGPAGPAGPMRPIAVQIDGEQIARIPVNVHYAGIDMPRPPVSVYCWDYVGDTVSALPGFTDLEAMAQDLSDHYVDAPWANSKVLDFPADGTIDEDGHITEPLDWSALDRWIARFPDARTYMIFPNFRWDLRQGLEDYSPRWKTAIGEWAQSMADHLRETGVDPSRVALLLIDEPHREDDERKIVEVARAIEATAPELRIFEDPVRPDPTDALMEMYEVSDILCPNLPKLYRGGQAAIDFYQDLQAQGTEFHIYQCSGPHKLLDPITYHRNQFWHAWNLGATACGYWGYVDAKTTGSSWDNFKGGGTSYSLVYADDENRLATSKQWEAVREGAQDYTLLWMLREAVEGHEGAETDAIRHARELLETLPGQIADRDISGTYKWTDDRDRSATDDAREQLLQALMTLQAER
ncbi:MAG: hypothetical protein ACQER1_18310 [Armatimonadota bacterium]